MWRLYQLLIGLWMFLWTVLCIGPLGNHFYALWKEPPPELIDFLQANWRSELIAVLVVGMLTGLSAINIRKKRRREKIERQQREQEEQERRDRILLEHIDHKIRPANHKVTALHQLPSPPANFTGRTTEITELMAVLERGGVVISSLQGMGGIGKTALALKLAEQLTPRYSDAQFYVDLKGVSAQPLSPTAAMGHIIHAYHPTAKLPESEAELSGLYRSVLHGQHALLVMDNAANKEQVEPLIPPSSCIMLVTSRQHFTLPRLFARRLDILSPNDARDLIIDIVPRIGKHANALAEVCGYLPLALRVAASTLAERIDLSPEDYLRRLKDAQHLLKLTGVEASLNLSFELLSPELQQLWCLLAVFRHTFDSGAAAAVWELELDPAQDILNTLLTYSLVEWNPGNARYRLHDLVHLFTNTRLNKNERAAGQKRHSIYYKTVLAKTEKLYLQRGEALQQVLALFDLERENIQRGQAWAKAHARQDNTAAQLCIDYPKVGAQLLAIRQHLRERTGWLKAALATARLVGNHAEENTALIYLGKAYSAWGQFRQALEYSERALILARESRNRQEESLALSDLSFAYVAIGNPRRAIECCEQELTIVREMGDRYGESVTLGTLGEAYKALGEFDRTIQFQEQALAITREIDYRRGEGLALNSLGLTYMDLKQPHRAAKYFEQALVIAREINDRHDEGTAVGRLGNAYWALGSHRRALKLHKQALVIAREMNDRHTEINSLIQLSLSYLASKYIYAIECVYCIIFSKLPRAIVCFEQALLIAREIGDLRNEGIILGFLGAAYGSIRQLQRAIEFYQQALAIARKVNDRYTEGEVLFSMSLILYIQGSRHQEISCAEAALRICEDFKSPTTARIRKQLGRWRK